MDGAAPAAPMAPLAPMGGPHPHSDVPLADGPEAISGPTAAGRDPPPSPMVDRKKHRRKKLSTLSKTEGSAGQAEGERRAGVGTADTTGTRPPPHGDTTTTP